MRCPLTPLYKRSDLYRGQNGRDVNGVHCTSPNKLSVLLRMRTAGEPSGQPRTSPLRNWGSYG